MKFIKINGERVEYKSTHAALREYERMTGRPADKITTYTDTTDLMYAIAKTQFRYAGLEFKMTIDEFIEYIDKNPEALEGFAEEEPGTEGSDEKEKKS